MTTITLRDGLTIDAATLSASANKVADALRGGGAKGIPTIIATVCNVSAAIEELRAAGAAIDLVQERADSFGYCKAKYIWRNRPYTRRELEAM